MQKVTGAELVKRVLRHSQGSVERLIELAGRRETDWLELKAATLPECTLENGVRLYLHEKVCLASHSKLGYPCPRKLNVCGKLYSS